MHVAHLLLLLSFASPSRARRAWVGLGLGIGRDQTRCLSNGRMKRPPPKPTSPGNKEQFGGRQGAARAPSPVVSLGLGRRASGGVAARRAAAAAVRVLLLRRSGGWRRDYHDDSGGFADHVRGGGERERLVRSRRRGVGASEDHSIRWVLRANRTTAARE
jgi:hypothetical protein